jgi:hypothetical protein
MMFPFSLQRVDKRVCCCSDVNVIFWIPKYLGFMKTPDLPKPGFFFKGFPEDVRFRRHTVPDSLEIARGTMYETWYRCLKLSPYMAESVATGSWRSIEQQQTYEQFGDLVGTTFESWWIDRGYELFREKGDFKRIGIQQAADTSDDGGTLVLEIPLTVSPATLKEQFDDLLRLHHPHFKRFDRWQHSSATSRLRSSKLTSLSLNLYVNVYEHWLKDTSAALYEIGEQMALNPRYVVKRNDMPEDVKDKHLQMSLMVSEYLGKAKNLVAHASEGRFPCTDDHDWIERATRAANWRQRE